MKGEGRASHKDDPKVVMWQGAGSTFFHASDVKRIYV